MVCKWLVRRKPLATLSEGPMQVWRALSFGSPVLPLRLTALILALASITILAASMSPLSANGGSRPLATDARSGPYELQIGVFPGIPQVGNLHVTIQVNAASDDSAVTDAVITLAARGPVGSSSVGPVPALNTPQSPQFYDADLPLDAAGAWTLSVETDAGLGRASLDVPFQVREGGGIDLVYVLAGGVALAAIVLWVLERIGKRRRRRSAGTPANR